MSKNVMAMIGGGVLFLLGLVIGLLAGGPSEEEIAKAVGARLDAAAVEQEGRIAAVESGFGELREDIAARFDELRTVVDGGAQAAAGLGSELEGLGASFAASLQSAADEQKAALEAGLAGLRGQIAAPAASDQEAGADGGAEASQAPAAAASSEPVDGHAPGETAMLSDGALRVFVSRIDEAAGTVAVRANGSDLVLSAGQSQTLAGESGECRLTLDAVGGGRAALSAACGDALPAPQGVAPGETVALAEGLSVFVSGVTDAGARIAVNGVTTQTVPVGEAVEVEAGGKACEVSVTGVDRGRVALGYTCG